MPKKTMQKNSKCELGHDWGYYAGKADNFLHRKCLVCGKQEMQIEKEKPSSTSASGYLTYKAWVKAI